MKMPAAAIEQRGHFSLKGGPQRDSPIQVLIVKGRCFNAEDLVQLR